MINLIFMLFVSAAFVNLMFLTSFLISKKIYDDAKLLIQEINKYAESENYAVVTARFKKFKKDIN